MADKLRVLLIEDVETDAELNLRALKRAGIVYEAQRVDRQADFEQALEAFVPQVILSDFALPGFDGLSALQIARQRNPEIPFIFVSGNLGEEKAIQSLQQGATDYVIKGNLVRLAPAVQRALQGAEQYRAQRDAEERLKLMASALENTAEGVMITDNAQRVVFVNRGYCAITGHSETELIGRKAPHLEAGENLTAAQSQFWDSLNATGLWRGEFQHRRKNGEAYPALVSVSAVLDTAGTAQHHVSVFNDIHQFKQIEQRLEFLAHHDVLTALPNRGLLQERVREALVRAHRHGALVAMLYIDLDRFKNVNDSLGHTIGDQLLKAVGERLTACVRECDTVARIGGDEFAIVLEEIMEVRNAARVAQKLINVLARPYAVADLELFSSASIGISCYPADGADAETLLKHADAALYRAKERGRNSYEFFSSEMTVRAVETLVMVNDLRQAAERDEFVLHYQPVIHLESKRVTRVEALIRWQHPRLGMILPNDFVRLAEETGLIGAITEWVLKEACKQAKRWQDAGVPACKIAVNLSARQLRGRDIAERIAAILAETGLEARWLELELTESVMMHDPKASQILLQELHDMGIGIAIDDFGVGYSSLSYLKRFPIDNLKIDKSFIDDIPTAPDDCAITQTIIAMAKSLKLVVIAEGVENEAQHAFLKASGCAEAQGYLFSKPLRAVELEPWLRRRGVVSS